MHYIESVMRDEESLAFASELHRRGIKFRYIGNMCFELMSMREVMQAFELAVRCMPDVRWKLFRMTGTDGCKYYVEAM